MGRTHPEILRLQRTQTQDFGSKLRLVSSGDSLTLAKHLRLLPLCDSDYKQPSNSRQRRVKPGKGSFCGSSLHEATADSRSSSFRWSTFSPARGTEYRTSASWLWRRRLQASCP